MSPLPHAADESTPVVLSASITESQIDLGQLLQQVQAPSLGASVLFTGSVRDVHKGRAVTALDYTAYVPMAEKLLVAILHEACERFGTAQMRVVHRVGLLHPGDVSVAIAVAHGHRGPAFDAARFVIEQIKLRVPIWKREHYADGELTWVNQSDEVQVTSHE